MNTQQMQSERASARQSERYSQEEQNEEEQIDWQRVGRQYKAEDGIETVMEREMNRLKQAMEQRMAA